MIGLLFLAEKLSSVIHCILQRNYFCSTAEKTVKKHEKNRTAPPSLPRSKTRTSSTVFIQKQKGFHEQTGDQGAMRFINFKRFQN